MQSHIPGSLAVLENFCFSVQLVFFLWYAYADQTECIFLKSLVLEYNGRGKLDSQKDALHGDWSTYNQDHTV